MSVSFLIVDDDFGSRGGMAVVLKSMFANCVVHETRSVRSATALLQQHPGVALVLLDLNVDDSRGLDTLRTLKAWCETNEVNPRIVVVSAGGDYDETLIPAAIEHCATGFIPKGTTEEIFRSAIELTLAGSIFIPQQYLDARHAAHREAAAPEAGLQLTPREQQVAALLVQGLTYKQIARRLQQSSGGRPMSDNTVRVHVQRIAWKLRLTDAEQVEGLSAKSAVLTAFAARRLRFGQEVA